MAEKYLTKAELVASRNFPFQTVELPTGNKVLMKVPSARDWRLHQQTLRSKDGQFMDERMDRGDELLIASILVDSNGQRLFSVEEVMSGVFDQIPAASLNVMLLRAYDLYGRGSNVPNLDELEKKSEGTPSNE